MNKQIVFSFLMIPMSIGIAVNRFALGHEYWCAFWLFVAFAHVMAIREQIKMKNRKEPQ